MHQTGELAERFTVPPEEVHEVADAMTRRYNLGPSEWLPTVVQQAGRRHLDVMRWGFLPPWAKDEKSVFKYKTFNARSEEIFDKPLWKHAIRHSRCLVPANGFYEWQASASGKQPFFVHPKDQGLFAFAGIYGMWRDTEGNEWPTYAILTTAANQDMAAIHERMPVILQPGDEERWLDPANDTPERLTDLLVPYPTGHLELYPVSREVNTVRVDKDTLLLPIDSQ